LDGFERAVLVKAAFLVLAKGGFVMIPLALCSVLALAVVIERAWRWLSLGGTADAGRVIAAAARGEWEAAARTGEGSGSPVARVLAAGLRHRSAPTLAMEAAAQDEVASLRRYLALLDTVITLAPLLGLLGTVTGMIGAFGIMAQAGLNQPTAITGGVGEALVATASGLAVAIAALVPYNFFQRRADAMAESIERYGTRLELVLAEASRARHDAAA
jgi:biopolymer transport protein ExbB